MRITYRTLAAVINNMSEEQKDSDVAVEIADEGGCGCYYAELRIADDQQLLGLFQSWLKGLAPVGIVLERLVELNSEFYPFLENLPR